MQWRLTLSRSFSGLRGYKFESKDDINVNARRMSESGDITWLRRTAARIVTWNGFELLVALIFGVNLVFIILETDAQAELSVADEAADTAAVRKELETFGHLNTGFLCFYGMELALRMYALRCHFFKAKVNVLDLVVVCIDLVSTCLQAFSQDLPNIAVFRIMRFMRLLRLTRALKVIVAFRELYVMIHGFFSAIRAVFWAAVLIMIALTVCSILAVEILHPLNTELAEEGQYDNCQRCAHAFETVGQSTLTFIQQIIAGDSWGEVSVPIIERHPWTLPIFVSVLLSVNLGLLNLVLTAIVERAAVSREHDIAMRLAEKKEYFAKSKDRLLKVFHDIDTDQDGSLSLEELIEGYGTGECAKIFEVLGVDRQEIHAVYDILDTASCGKVGIDEFIDKVHAMQTRDQRTLIMILQAKVARMQEAFEKRLDTLQEDLGHIHEPGKQARTLPVSSADSHECSASDVAICAGAAEGNPDAPLLNPDEPTLTPSSAALRATSEGSAALRDSSEGSAALLAASEVLSKRLAEDLLESLRDIGRKLEQEVATNEKNSEALSALTLSLSTPRGRVAPDVFKFSGLGNSPALLLDGAGSPVRARGEPLPRMMDTHRSSPAKVGTPNGHDNRHVGGSQKSSPRANASGSDCRCAASPDPCMKASLHGCTPRAPLSACTPRRQAVQQEVIQT